MERKSKKVFNTKCNWIKKTHLTFFSFGWRNHVNVWFNYPRKKNDYAENKLKLNFQRIESTYMEYKKKKKAFHLFIKSWKTKLTDSIQTANWVISNSTDVFHLFEKLFYSTYAMRFIFIFQFIITNIEFNRRTRLFQIVHLKW